MSNVHLKDLCLEKAVTTGGGIMDNVVERGQTIKMPKISEV